MLNWGFLIIICALLAANCIVSFSAEDKSIGEKRLMRGWNAITFYASFALLAQTTF